MRWKIIRLLFYFIIASGFISQSQIGWSEYFRYQTTTRVSVLHFPEEIVIPTLALGAIRKRKYMPINKIFESKLFDNLTIWNATFSGGKCATDTGYYDGELLLLN